ncbi:hypothetical protein [Streptomyces sp. TRM49041]|uniref:hypothetical protein n=1 Tax=Streptomyces sp. TRM49041 TaxID=2603216 RepID=UPI0021CCDF83|nr:hypothetical protein [Streptomyces sp. TRM49041]
MTEPEPSVGCGHVMLVPADDQPSQDHEQQGERVERDEPTATGTATESSEGGEAGEAYSAVVRVAEDVLFGGIRVSLDTVGGAVTVHGDAVPGIAVRRADGVDRVDAHIPVGTRDGALLSLTVDGADVPIRPGKGRLTRGSFRVDVPYDGIVYRLVPDSMAESRLLRGRQRIGGFSSDGDGVVLARWEEGVRVRAVEAALGYALAAAFGTGAQPMWLLMADALGDLIPG